MITIQKAIEAKKNKAVLLIIIVLITFFNLHAQEQDLKDIILEKDSIFWEGYNNCDIATMNRFLAEDLEFYHDKGGTELGSKELNEAFKKGLCKTGSNHLRREAVPNSVKIFPLMDNNKIYGAILSGEHLFYIQNEDSETLDGQAKFNHLWLLKNSEWKMHRILSYDHRAPEIQ